MIAIVAGDTSVGALDRVRKFIDEQVDPGDMVSVRSVQRVVIPVGVGGMHQVRDAMGIFQQFTNDKRQLDAATERLPRVCTMQHVCLTDMQGPPSRRSGAFRISRGAGRCCLWGATKGLWTKSSPSPIAPVSSSMCSTLRGS